MSTMEMTYAQSIPVLEKMLKKCVKKGSGKKGSSKKNNRKIYALTAAITALRQKTAPRRPKLASVRKVS